MHKFVFLMILLVLSWILIPPAAAQMDLHKGPMPDLIWGKTHDGAPDFPMWVAADRVLTVDGEVDRENFGRQAAYWIHQEFMRPDRDYDKDEDLGCLELKSPGDHHNNPELHWQDFSSVLADSELVVLAKVTGVRGGFNGFGIGVSILRLQPLQWFKGKEDWKLNYLQVPLGRLSLGGRDFCLGQAQFARFPETGSRVVVAYNSLFKRPGFRHIVTSAPKILTLSSDGTTSLPRWVRKKHPDWVDLPEAALLGEIEKMLRKGGKR